MKHCLKFISILLSLCLLMAVGCTAETKEPATTEQPVGIANPIEEVSTSVDVENAIGCKINHPYEELNVADENYSIIHGTPEIGQYRFIYNGSEYVLRCGITHDDISGIYVGNGTAADLIKEDAPYAIVETGSGLFCRWFLGGMQYSLSATGQASEEDMFLLRDTFALQWPWYYDDVSEEDYTDDSTWLVNAGSNATNYVHSQLLNVNTNNDTTYGTGDAIPYQSVPSYALPEGTVTVTDVSSFLAAIQPDTTIYLAPGTYDLTTAEGYGSVNGKYYQWEEEYDGYQLVLHNVKGLTIIGSAEEAEADGLVNLTSLMVTEPRYANVLVLRNCTDITLKGLTLGHTPEQGECCGGVIQLENAKDIVIESSDLYGCGTLGIDAINSSNVTVNDCGIHDCSYGLVSLNDCSSFSFEGCTFANTSGYAGVWLYDVGSITFTECDFAFNYLPVLLDIEGNSENIRLSNCLFAYNSYENAFIGSLDNVNLEGGAVLYFGEEQFRPLTEAFTSVG